MTLALRPYQSEAIEALEEAERRGVRSALVALPTGTGKTVVFSEWIRRRGGSALVLAHRDELLEQAERKIATVAPELALSIGRVQAGRDDVGAPLVVASVQTLARESRLARLPRRFRSVVVDEAHHAVAPSYRRILEHVDAEMVAGFTATPERHGDESLGDVFEEVAYGRSILEMIQEGYLCDPRGVRIELADLDLGDVRVSRGDYQASDLARAMRSAEAPAHTAAALVEHAADRKSIVFVPSVELAHDTAAAISAAGIPAAALDGSTPREERASILARLSAGELRAVVNVGVLTEGFDEPSVDCVAIAAPTRSRVRYVQMVGRGLRLHPGKEDCLVLDLAGVTDDLRLQSLGGLFGLEEPLHDGESVSEAVERQAVERRRREEGEAAARAEAERRRARKTELFGDRTSLHWLEVGDRWVLSAGRGEQVVLDPAGNGYRVLLMRKSGARILARDLDLGYALGAAEDAIRRRQARTLATPNAGWRRRPPSRNQLAYLRRLGVDTQPATAGEASDLIEEAIARERLEQLDRAEGALVA